MDVQFQVKTDLICVGPQASKCDLSHLHKDVRTDGRFGNNQNFLDA